MRQHCGNLALVSSTVFDGLLTQNSCMQHIYVRVTICPDFPSRLGKIIFSPEARIDFPQSVIDKFMQITACFRSFKPIFVQF